MMKFKIDENLPVEVAEVLRQAGYEAATVHDQSY
jgi:predicted nuclease of predicted toxin-antitoxin system